MKKVLCFAAAAMAIFASCQKTEVVYNNDGPQEIGIFAVNKVATKAPVDGATFLDGDNMSVAAYLVSGDGVTQGNFFDKTVFTKGSGNTWTGGRYWPISTATISFLAVTEKGGGVDNAETVFTTANEAEVTLSGNAVYNQNDLMYAAAQVKREQGNEYPEVGMVFKHALSWIDFKVKTNLTSGQATVKVNSITLNNVVTDGVLTVTNSKYALEAAPELTAVWDITGISKVNRMVPKEDKSENPAEVMTLNTTPQRYGNGILVVPGGSSTGFTINYTLKQKDDTEQTFNYTHTFTPAPTWQMAHKYTYQISINLSEIEVAPSVEAWDDIDEKGNEDPADDVSWGEDITLE